MGEDQGISNDFKPTRATAMIMASFAAISLYNVIELTFIIIATFKRRRGLFFWSFVVATWSIAPYILGFIFKFFSIIPERMVSVTMIVLGWCGMVTGQSVVLYSRLHLVVRDRKILRLVLSMIITNALICHVPIVVLVYGSNSSNPAPFVIVYSIYEKVQITIFFVQEVIISGLYVWATWTALEPGGAVLAKDLRKAMQHLIWINVFIVVLDLTVLATEYSGHYEIQVLYKGALYSAKLKLEFRILNQLVSLTKTKSPREWSKDDTTSKNQSTVHDLRTVDDRQSTRLDNLTIAGMYRARISRGEESGLPDFKAGIAMETTIEVTPSEIGTHLDNDSDRIETGSLAITCDTIEAHSEVVSTSSSRVGFAK
jgi:hypothetical protein